MFLSRAKFSRINSCLYSGKEDVEKREEGEIDKLCQDDIKTTTENTVFINPIIPLDPEIF